MNDRMTQNFTLLYKCNRCGDISNDLRLFCTSCGTRLITRPVLETIHENEKKIQGKDEL